MAQRTKQILYKEGNRHLKNKDLKAARVCFEEVLRSEPNDRIALHDLALIELQEGQLETSRIRLEKVIAQNPDFVLAKITLSNVLVRQNDINSAIFLLEKSLKGLEAKEERFLVMDSLIEKYFAKGSHLNALSLLNEILANPEWGKNTKFLNAAGTCNYTLDRINKAIELYEKSLQIDPDQAAVHSALSDAFQRLKDYPSMRVHLEKFIKLSPGNEVYYYLRMATSLEAEYRFSDALKRIKIILDKDPGNFTALQEAIKLNTKMLNFKSSREVVERLVSMVHEETKSIPQGALFTLSISEDVSLEDLYSVHKKYAELMIPDKGFTANSAKTIEKSIRVGFVSPDYYKHPVSQFFLPLLKAFQRMGLTTYGYSNTISPDQTTTEFKKTFSVWRSIVGIPDDLLAQRIFEDKIDVLVDLSGHTTDNRISVFAYHPAKVTCTYLGYLTTTGLSTMDYWILDDTVFPDFMEEKLSEKPYRLKRPWISYPIPKKKPEVTPIRKSILDPIIFGTANNVIKYSERSIKLFAKVLKALPKSRLMLKHANFTYHDHIINAQNAFSEYGIPSNRLIFKGFDPSFEDHIKTLQQIDIALDTIPFNGGTTTCDTLFAGVPVLTLVGRRFISRMSATILHSLGLDEWICATEEEFVAKACTFAVDIEGRNQFRATIQQRMADSKLCDVDDLAKCMIEAFHDMLAKAGY